LDNIVFATQKIADDPNASKNFTSSPNRQQRWLLHTSQHPGRSAQTKATEQEAKRKAVQPESTNAPRAPRKGKR
jgi:hypothetical protein